MKIFKVLLVGDSGVGKSCLLLRYAEKHFRDNYVATIATDFRVPTLEVDGQQVQLQIWDTAGQERFRTITTAYYRGAQGILVVYDTTNARSFNNVQMWLDEIHQYAGLNVNCMLVGNKVDMKKDKAVDKKIVKDFARKVGSPGTRSFVRSFRSSSFEPPSVGRARAQSADQYDGELPLVEVSAKSNEGVTEMFEQLTRMMLKTSTGVSINEVMPANRNVQPNNHHNNNGNVVSQSSLEDMVEDDSSCC